MARPNGRPKPKDVGREPEETVEPRNCGKGECGPGAERWAVPRMKPGTGPKNPDTK